MTVKTKIVIPPAMTKEGAECPAPLPFLVAAASPFRRAPLLLRHRPGRTAEESLFGVATREVSILPNRS